MSRFTLVFGFAMAFTACNYVFTKVFFGVELNTIGVAMSFGAAAGFALADTRGAR